MKWRGVAALVVAVLTALALFAVPPASSTTKHWPRVAVSLNGHTWVKQLHKPLFDKRIVWIPGDSRTRTFYVRNQSGERARLTISVNVNDQARMLRAGDMRVEARLGRTWMRIARPGNQKVARLVVKGGATRKVWVRVRMSPAAGNNTMDRRMPFTIRVRLTKLKHH